MKIYLCGQRSFGREVLRQLLQTSHEITGVSAPAQGSEGKPDRLHRFASEMELPVLDAGELRASLLTVGTDLLICAHSHDFIGRKTRQTLSIGAIGYHPSLLPLHRGRDAIKWTIRNNERITGGSVYWLNDTVDGGPIAAQEYCFVRPDDDASSLWQRELFPLGVRLIMQTVADIERGVLVRIPQDPECATWEPALDAPPLHRPELPELLPPGYQDSFRVVMEKRAGAPF